MKSFHGAKIALIYSGTHILVCLRDDKPEIPFPGLWDLPGGGHENNESPFECAARELHEEFAIILSPQSILFERMFPSQGSNASFLVGTISKENIEAIKFGDEGQGWKLMPIPEFLARKDVVPTMQTRLKICLKELAVQAS